MLGHMIHLLKMVHLNSQYHSLKNIQTSHQLWDSSQRCFIRMVSAVCIYVHAWHSVAVLMMW